MLTTPICLSTVNNLLLEPGSCSLEVTSFSMPNTTPSLPRMAIAVLKELKEALVSFSKLMLLSLIPSSQSIRAISKHGRIDKAIFSFDYGLGTRLRALSHHGYRTPTHCFPRLCLHTQFERLFHLVKTELLIDHTVQRRQGGWRQRIRATHG